MPRRAAPAIRHLPFRHNVKPGLGFEIFQLSELVARAERRALDHELDAPQRPDGQGGFFVTSTVIVGDKEAVLVDAQFSLAEAHRLVAQILESKKTLTAASK